MPLSAANRQRHVDHRGIVRGDGRVVPLGQQRLHLADECGVDVGFSLIGDGFRLLVGAFDEPHPRAERVDALDVPLGPVEVGLQHDADVPVALLPQRLEDLERRIRVRRALHVDAHEEAVGGVKNPSHVVDRRRPIDGQSELRELERQVALDAGAGHGLNHPAGSRAVAASASARLVTLSPR